LGENITLLLYGVDLRGLGLEPDYFLLLRRQPLLLAVHLHKKKLFFLVQTVKDQIRVQYMEMAKKIIPRFTVAMIFMLIFLFSLAQNTPTRASALNAKTQYRKFETNIPRSKKTKTSSRKEKMRLKNSQEV
jgi:hypothetical protein